MSCGWSFIDLHNQTGKLIDNKVYKLHVNGGTIFERGVDLDPSVTRQKPTNRLRALMVAQREPVLYVKIATPGRKYRKFLDFLPSTIIIPLCCGQLVSYYRRHLADVILRNRKSASDASIIHSPEIMTFLLATDHCDVMDGIRNVWARKQAVLKPTEKRDKELQKVLFNETVMQIGYPLLHSRLFTKSIWADDDIRQKRWTKMVELVSKPREEGTLKYLLSTTTNNFEPFHTDEVAFDLFHIHDSSKKFSEKS